MDADFTSRVMRACQLLKAHDLEDVASFLANAELAGRRTKRKPKMARMGKHDWRGQRGGNYQIATEEK